SSGNSAARPRRQSLFVARRCVVLRSPCLVSDTGRWLRHQGNTSRRASERPLDPRRNDMDLQIRRVVTCHDAEGHALGKIDGVCGNLISTRKGQQSCVVWTTDTAPANNDVDEDTSQRSIGTTIAGGTVFRIVRYDPGVAPRNHRTDSIDYAVVIAGEIDMELDGTSTKLRAGDVL